MKGLLFLLEIGVWAFLFVLIITRTATEKDYVQLAFGILLLILRCAKIVKDKWLQAVINYTFKEGNSYD